MPKPSWENTRFDIEAHHFQYVYFVPETMVTTIDVVFEPIDERATLVNVVYTRTAVDRAANEHVRSLGARDSESGTQWESAIAEYLEHGRRGKANV